jgi:hypothetical protein
VAGRYSLWTVHDSDMNPAAEGSVSSSTVYSGVRRTFASEDKVGLVCWVVVVSETIDAFGVDDECLLVMSMGSARGGPQQQRFFRDFQTPIAQFTA